MTIGNMISKLEAFNRLLEQAKAEGSGLESLWRRNIDEYHEKLAALGFVVEYPEREEEEAA